MRGFFIAVIAVLVLFVIGWLSIGVTPDHATINIETEEIREDTAGAIEATREFAEDAVEESSESAQEIDENVDVDVDVNADAEAETVQEERSAPDDETENRG